ncbi:MAG: (2Fe-2S) ferredoxin domain-containing protein [Sedimentisphaerales bacterium]
MITVTICVGSSCHIKGARELIARFNDFLRKENLEDRVELKGSFCMERCGEGINWRINDEILSSPSVEEGAEMFRKKVLEALKAELPENSVEESGERRV